MIFLLPGLISFVCFFLFDIAKSRNGRFAPLLFLTGMLLLACSTAGMFFSYVFEARPLWRAICGVMAAFWLLALLYVLFGALPAKQVYAEPGAPQVYKNGVYALCRHPGGWCFMFFYWFLWLFSPSTPLLIAAIVFPGLNFLYIWIQDFNLFPKYIIGYDAYRKETPFLLPTHDSIRNFLSANKENI